jgi:DNA invertase Pin-like site-specific DNA recombinase
MSSKAIYLRVSKEDLDESKQLVGIQNKYHLIGATIYKEKISAYLDEKQELRTAFQQLKQDIIEKKITEVYIYSIERLERNIIRLFEFYFFCEAHDCKIYSVQQDIPNKKDSERPMDTFLRFVNVLLFGYKGQEESYTISYRTKEAFEKHNNNTFSYKGNKVGKRFTDLDGNTIEISAVRLNKLQKRIKELIRHYSELKYKSYYKEIIETIGQEYKIKISKAYISILKNGRDRK